MKHQRQMSWSNYSQLYSIVTNRMCVTEILSLKISWSIQRIKTRSRSLILVLHSHMEPNICILSSELHTILLLRFWKETTINNVTCGVLGSFCLWWCQDVLHFQGQMTRLLFRMWEEENISSIHYIGATKVMKSRTWSLSFLKKTLESDSLQIRPSITNGSNKLYKLSLIKL